MIRGLITKWGPNRALAWARMSQWRADGRSGLDLGDKHMGCVLSTYTQLRPAARKRLAKKGYDPDFGARPLERLIQKEIKNALTDEVLFGRLKGGGRVIVDVDDAGEFEFSFGDQRQGFVTSSA